MAAFMGRMGLIFDILQRPIPIMDHSSKPQELPDQAEAVLGNYWLACQAPLLDRACEQARRRCGLRRCYVTEAWFGNACLILHNRKALRFDCLGRVPGPALFDALQPDTHCLNLTRSHSWF